MATSLFTLGPINTDRDKEIALSEIENELNRIARLANAGELQSEIEWSGVLNTPTTVVGYGITDVYTEVEVDGLLAGKADIVHTHVWGDVSKVGSSLGDLETRSAGDLSSGNLAYARLPTGTGTWTLGGDLSITGGHVGIGQAASAIYALAVARHAIVEGDLDLYNTTGNPEITFLADSDPSNHRAIIEYNYAGKYLAFRNVRADLTTIETVGLVLSETNTPVWLFGRNVTTSVAGTALVQLARSGNVFIAQRNTAAAAVGNLCGFSGWAMDNGGTEREIGLIEFRLAATHASSPNGEIRFNTRTAAGLAQAMILKANASLLVGTTSTAPAAGGIRVAGQSQFDNLAGTGTRAVVVDANGVLSAP